MKFKISLVIGLTLLVSTTLLGLRSTNYKHPQKEPAAFSPAEEAMFERLSKQFNSLDPKAEYRPDPSGKSPGFLRTHIKFESVRSIDDFRRKFALWQTMQANKQVVENLDRKVKQISTKGVKRGKRYPTREYFNRVDFMRDLAHLYLEAGYFADARKVLDILSRSINEYDGTDVDDFNKKKVRLLLQAELSWTRGDILNEPDSLNASFSLYNDLVEMDPKEEIRNSNRIMMAERHYGLAKNGFNRDSNLQAAKNLLETVSNDKSLDIQDRVLYVNVLTDLKEFKSAYNQLVELMKTIKDISSIKEPLDLDMRRIAQIEQMARLETPGKFIEAYGPFAQSIYEECSGTRMADAQPRPNVISTTSDEAWVGSRALLLGNTIIYEESPDSELFSQAEIIMHEFIHIQVKTHSTVKSNGRWYSVYRDVPTAALWTYVRLAEKFIKKQADLPASLIQNINLGRDTVKNNPENVDKYIDNMLAYFKFHGLETDAAYVCAAIQAGMIIELMGDDKLDIVQNYVQHLTIKPHKDALMSALKGEKITL